MEEVIVYQFESLYRDHFRIKGFRFGSGKKALAIVGSMRGNEYQQLFTCSQLVKTFRMLESDGKLIPDHEILIIPCANPYSMNIKKRFWTIDNTDINRMFPGYNEGETTQRIADGLFEAIKDYPIGIQFASFYMKGSFAPHVRIMRTGLENIEMGKQFGMPYVIVREPRPFDTTTLNYNWQIWETDAFSLYTTNTDTINRESASEAVLAILRMAALQGIIEPGDYGTGVESEVLDDRHLVTIRSSHAGFFDGKVRASDRVEAGALLADITDPLTGDLLERLYAPIGGTLLFIHTEDMVYSNTAVFKMITN